jgi:hypothetical protein
MFGNDRSHRRMMAAVLALAVPAFLITACNDDPLFDLPPDPPTNVVASVAGQDVTVNWVPGSNATSQEVRLTPVTPVPASAGNALQAQDYVQVYNDNTTNTHTFTDVEPGAYTATVTAINASSRAPSEIANVLVEGSGGGTTPAITSFTAVEGALVVEWTAVATAENYHVTLTDGDGNVVEEVTDLSTSPTSYTFTATPEVGVTYTVEVCAVFDLGATEECGATVDHTVISFGASVLPYFSADQANCVSCHGGATPIGGISLETYEGIVNGEDGDGNPLIVIGDAAAAEAILIPQLLADHQNGPDDQAFVDDVLTSWINDGAPNN